MSETIFCLVNKFGPSFSIFPVLVELVSATLAVLCIITVGPATISASLTHSNHLIPIKMNLGLIKPELDANLMCRIAYTNH